MTENYKVIYRKHYINEQGKTPEEADAAIRYIEGMDSCDYYWLRSPGLSQYDAAYVNDDGSMHDGGYYVYVDIRGIRPTLWVNL